MANNFFIAYDLDTPGQLYGKIEQAISECGEAVKVQMSLYYLSSSHTIETIREHCAKSMDSNDRLLVIQASGATWYNSLPGAEALMQQRWNS